MVEKELSRDIAKARNELLRIDSLYRNRLWAYNLLDAEIQDRREQLAEAGTALERLELAVEEAQALEERQDDLESYRDKVAQEMERVDGELLLSRAAAFEAETALRNKEAAYFQGVFASIRPPGDLIVQAIASHQGCLVCGNHEASTYERARRMLDAHHCPVCEAALPQVEGVADLTVARLPLLKDAERILDKTRGEYRRLETAAERLRGSYQKTLEALRTNRQRLMQARAAVQQDEGKAGAQQEFADLKDKLDAAEREVSKLRADLQAAIQTHELLVARSRGDIERFKDAVIAAFDHYAKDFMVENCRLRYVSDRRARVAQSDSQIDWPAFQVMLASGIDGRLTERSTLEEVSESQKEFIDLAFRMALLKVATQGAPSMLVVETPEASLDTFFVERAGKLLREYASDKPGNLLLVTSNLTKEQMISALLGVPDFRAETASDKADKADAAEPPEAAEDLAERLRHVLNLLRIARPTRAYIDNRERYDAAFKNAVGDRPKPSGTGVEFDPRASGAAP